MQFIQSYQIENTGVCADLIVCFEDCRERGIVHRGAFGPNNVDETRKNSWDLTLGNVPADLQAAHGPALRDYFGELGRFMEDYLRRFPHLATHTRTCHINEPPNIQYYPPGGGFFEEHFENAGREVATRVLTFQTYLNSIASGGGTHFVYQNHTVEPAAGKTILWPAGFTHVHRGVVAPDEHKYVITGWWSYD